MIKTALAAVAIVAAVGVLTPRAGAQLAGNTLSTAADGKFAKAAVLAGNNEIDQARAELKTTTDPSVKLYAKTIVKDFTLINAQLAGVAKGAGFNVPKQIEGTGASLSYEDPKKYFTAEVAAHEQLLTLFNAEYRNGSRQFQAVVGPAIQTLQQHLKMAQEYLKTGTIAH